MTVLPLTRFSNDPLPYRLIDKVVALAALLFLASCLCSFVSLRLEQRAAWIFMTGLLLLGVDAVILAFVVQ